MRTISILLLGSLVAGCSMTAPPPPPSERAQTRLAQELAGLVVGQPQSCLPHYRADQGMTVIDDNTILFRDGSTRVYRNETQGICSGLSSGNTLVFRTTGSALCRGDIGVVTDLRTGVVYGSCVLGDFVPYARP